MEPITTFESTAIVFANDDIDTDQIIPARFLKGTVRSGLAEALFADRRTGSPFESPFARAARILVTGRNFGCGSSREHAVWALYEFGFRAVVAPSFADIFRANALENGLLPITLDATVHAAVLATLEAEPATRITIDLPGQYLVLPGGRRITFAIDPYAKHRLTRGVDTLSAMLAAAQEIDRYEELHPPPVRTTLSSSP
jgi:3-isopropylmalate/(R)-2-methylmalate dehydratase small subunit